MKNLANIAPEFLFIEKYNFTLENFIYSPQNFGNAILIITDMTISLQFKLDRGELFVDIGNESIGWFKLEDIVEFINNQYVFQGENEVNKRKYLSKLLEENWDIIYNLLNNKEDRNKLNVFCKNKTSSYLRNIFGE